MGNSRLQPNDIRLNLETLEARSLLSGLVLDAPTVLAVADLAVGGDTAALVQTVQQPVAPVLQTTLAPAVEQGQAVVNTVLAPISQALAPVVAPVLEQVSQLTQALAPVTEPVLQITDGVVEVAMPLLAPVGETVVSLPFVEPVVDSLSSVSQTVESLTSLGQVVDVLPATDLFESVPVLNDVIETVPGLEDTIEQLPVVVGPGPEPGIDLPPLGLPDLGSFPIPGTPAFGSDGGSAVGGGTFVPPDAVLFGADEVPFAPTGFRATSAEAALDLVENEAADTLFSSFGIAEEGLAEGLLVAVDFVLPSEASGRFEAGVAENGSAMQQLGPREADLVVAASPSTAALDMAIRQFLAGLDDLGRDLANLLAHNGLLTWLLAAAAGAGALELTRRRLRRRQMLPAGDAPRDDADTLSWVPGLPHPFRNEDA
jgi:hypothetical protein